ncbi:hypothetical protein Spb1_15190 [Planctopirus ephydatiae]|uniref:Uncharacterized protein n=1 Tax=Planctopirus ephydatiae TaxID=2528019 RepID=A0A518GM25_9PLAN|nr:hypothetical protein Spb1_15190 [Planctopirus ephydatiae]
MMSTVIELMNDALFFQGLTHNQVDRQWPVEA